MIRVGRLFEPEITRVAGCTPVIRFNLTCCKCGKTPKSGTIRGSKILPDIAVANQFKKRGWLIAKTRAHDICPDCLKVEDKNRLAGVFKVSDKDGVILSPDQIVDEFAAESAKKRKETKGILSRHFGENPPSNQSLVPAATGKKAPTDEATFKAIVANDIQEIRAAVELIAEQNGHRTELLKQQNQGHAIHLSIMQQHIEYFGRLVEATERNNALMDQLVRALAINTNEVALIPQTVVNGCRDVVSAIRDHADTLVPALTKVPEAIHEQPSGPAAAQPVEPAEDPAPSPAREPRLKRKSASVSVYSCPKRQPDKFYTSISVPRALWESVGFTEEDRYTIDVDDDMKITIARATEGGVKPKKIGRDVVVFQTSQLGDLTTRRLFVKACDGVIRI